MNYCYVTKLVSGTLSRDLPKELLLEKHFYCFRAHYIHLDDHPSLAKVKLDKFV